MTAAAPIDPPPPGVYPDVPFETYLAWRAVSSHLLGQLQLSAKHALHAFNNPSAESPELSFGRLVHAMVLAPQELAGFGRKVRCGAITKKGLQCSKMASVITQKGPRCGNHAEGDPDGWQDTTDMFSDAEWAQAEAMAKAVRECRPARILLDQPGQNELSLVWIDPDLGEVCKGRLDIYRPGWATIADLKTAFVAEPSKFNSSCIQYGYDRQMAFYRRGARALGLTVERSILLAVEKTAPYAVAPYLMSDAMIEAGALKNAELFNRYVSCRRTGIWPGYERDGADFLPLELPTTR